ncbi:MAG: glycosyltransferase [Chloroflexia bacterium]
MTSAKRFLFASTGGYGHLNPLIPIARELKAAGHSVAFTTRATRAALIEGSGFDFFPIGGDLVNDPEFQAVKAELNEMPTTLETELYAYPRLFAGIGPRLRTPDLIGIAERWQADMVVREVAEYSSLNAAEHLGLPHAAVAFTTALRCMSLFERNAGSQIDPTRVRWGLPPDPDLVAPYRYLHLSYVPPTFGTHDLASAWGETSIPLTTHFIRPELFDNINNDTLPDWMETLPDQPTVYLTLGTEVNGEPEFYPSVLQTLIEGLRELPINLIVTLGREKDIADFGPQPPNVHIEHYIPQSLLLPRCDLMVMHGGSNSLLAAMDIGLPLVIVPLIADQFFNAHIIESLQVGRVVPYDQLTPESIRTAVSYVLHNPLYRRNMGRLEAEMHALPGMLHALELIERVAVTREPVINKGLVPEQ